MTEKLVIVPKVVTGKTRAIHLGIFVVACVLLFLTLFVAAELFFLPAVIAILLWVWRTFWNHVEYEYTYYNGDLCIAKITNKARRKNLAEINMEEVVLIAPKGDRGVSQYERKKEIAVKDYTSGDVSAKVYELIHSADGNTCRYEFEPDEEMLQAIRMKYPRLVTK